MMAIRKVGPILGLALALGACGESSSGGPNGGAGLPGVGQSKTETCSNDAICTVALPHGAELTALAGSLPSDELAITIEAVVRESDTARSHTYVLRPSGIRFSSPVLMTIPVLLMPGEGSEQLWCRHSSFDQSFDVFDEVSMEDDGRGAATITCSLPHFSAVSASVGETFAIYRGLRVAKSALDACGQRGFSSEAACTNALSGNASCSYCGGRNDCWIPGGGGDCCPDEADAFDDPCWLSFQTAPVGAPRDACAGQGFSSYGACVNSGVPGIDCSYCGGDNDCWIPGGGGDCCPSASATPPDGCETGTSLKESRSACGGSGYWTEAACQQRLKTDTAEDMFEGVCYCECGGSCRFCGGHNLCWIPWWPATASGVTPSCPGEYDPPPDFDGDGDAPPSPECAIPQ